MLKVKEQIKASYNNNSDFYLKRSLINDEYSNLIKDNTSFNSILLDVGCGGGRLTISINEHVKKIIGIDFSKELIKKAKKFNQKDNIEYLIMDAENLNFENDSIDCIVSHFAINKDMCKAESLFKSTYSVLKKGGKVIVRMIHKDWGKEFNFKSGYTAKEVKDILKNLGYKKISNKILRFHQKVDSLESLK